MLGKAQEEILPGLSANGEELLSPGGAAALLQRQLDAHPQAAQRAVLKTQAATAGLGDVARDAQRSEEHTSELQSLMRISYAVFCLKQKNSIKYNTSLHH